MVAFEFPLAIWKMVSARATHRVGVLLGSLLHLGRLRSRRRQSAVVLFGVELFFLDLAVEILLFFWASIQMDRAIAGCSGSFSPC